MLILDDKNEIHVKQYSNKNVMFIFRYTLEIFINNENSASI